MQDENESNLMTSSNVTLSYFNLLWGYGLHQVSRVTVECAFWHQLDLHACLFHNIYCCTNKRKHRSNNMQGTLRKGLQFDDVIKHDLIVL